MQEPGQLNKVKWSLRGRNSNFKNKRRTPFEKGDNHKTMKIGFMSH